MAETCAMIPLTLDRAIAEVFPKAFAETVN
jgi:hypothetical protein